MEGLGGLVGLDGWFNSIIRVCEKKVGFQRKTRLTRLLQGKLVGLK